MIYRSHALTDFVNQVVIQVPGPTPVWDVQIAEHPISQTVVFEAATDWNQKWVPVNGQRLAGPGPRLGTIWTNAVAGGPAHFRGALGRDKHLFRVRCTRYDNTPIDLTIETHDQLLKVRLIGTEPVTFIIEEEKTLQDLLSDELGLVNPK
jgi:hypothetical protein